MPMIPAICERCGSVFSSGIYAENVINLTFTDGNAGDCPRCGGLLRIKGGTFNVIHGVIEQIKESKYTRDELLELSSTLNKIKKETDSPEKMEKIIGNSNPKFSSVLELLPQNREEKRSDIKFVLTILIPTLLTILGMLISSSSNSPVNYNVNFDQVIFNNYENTEYLNSKSNKQVDRKPRGENISSASGAKIIKKNPIRVQKVGRNQECPCGSGIKFKKCHGK